MPREWWLSSDQAIDRELAQVWEGGIEEGQVLWDALCGTLVWEEAASCWEDSRSPGSGVGLG